MRKPTYYRSARKEAAPKPRPRPRVAPPRPRRLLGDTTSAQPTYPGRSVMVRQRPRPQERKDHALIPRPAPSAAPLRRSSKPPGRALPRASGAGRATGPAPGNVGPRLLAATLRPRRPSRKSWLPERDGRAGSQSGRGCEAQPRKGAVP